jgi:hypothetical protein
MSETTRAAPTGKTIPGRCGIPTGSPTRLRSRGRRSGTPRREMSKLFQRRQAQGSRGSIAARRCGVARETRSARPSVKHPAAAWRKPRARKSSDPRVLVSSVGCRSRGEASCSCSTRGAARQTEGTRDSTERHPAPRRGQGSPMRSAKADGRLMRAPGGRVRRSFAGTSQGTQSRLTRSHGRGSNRRKVPWAVFFAASNRAAGPMVLETCRVAWPDERRERARTRGTEPSSKPVRNDRGHQRS